ncbi:MAG: putative glycolipid-binding domain-containing protein [Thermomicrobiales bacterium]
MFLKSPEPIERIRRTNVIWEGLAWPGYEHLCLEEWTSGFTVDGLIIAVVGALPSRTWYRIELESDWTFRSLKLSHTVEFSDFDDGPLDLDNPGIDLVRATDGMWDHDLEDQSIDLAGCTDIDIAVTPFTNTLPIRRLNLTAGESAEIDVVYISVPDLALSPARQRYTRTADTTYRFESLSSGFTAEITVDEHGLVMDYPNLFRRVWPSRSS